MCLQVNQLSRDLQQVLDEKEELIMERDDYRHKYDRLNNELNYILKGDERRVLDIDSLIKENKSVCTVFTVALCVYCYVLFFKYTW